MKGSILFLLCLIFTIASTDTFAASHKNSRKGKSNIYISKKYKGHACPPKRKIINAKYF